MPAPPPPPRSIWERDMRLGCDCDHMLCGIHVRVDSSLPEGLIMFKSPDGRILGIIDNRKP